MNRLHIHVFFGVKLGAKTKLLPWEEDGGDSSEAIFNKWLKSVDPKGENPYYIVFGAMQDNRQPVYIALKDMSWTYSASDEDALDLETFHSISKITGTTQFSQLVNFCYVHDISVAGDIGLYIIPDWY